jgi:molybdopterin-containing oxidoreductase family membrane subunit
MGVWPQFRSPLIWDFFAISTYGLVSLLFWYVGLIPDLATMRDRSKNQIFRVLYGFFAMGWRGSARHWHRYQKAYFLLAALATPLVISVHSIVSTDFAFGIVPGWHSTIFPPYFVAGALFAGFAMVLNISIPVRAIFKLEDFITMRHLRNMAFVMLASGLIVAYGYAMDFFMAWYSGVESEQAVMLDRVSGAYAPIFWAMILCNVVIPQAIWLGRVRNNVILLWLVALAVNIGMWFERFVIIVQSLHRDFLPSSWGMYTPTIWDLSTFIGTIGLFLALIFLFVRVLPMISIFEMRELVAETQEREEHAAAATPAE